MKLIVTIVRPFLMDRIIAAFKDTDYIRDNLVRVKNGKQVNFVKREKI